LKISQSFQLLALVAVLASVFAGSGRTRSCRYHSGRRVALAIGGVALVFVAGRYLMNPLFAFLAWSGAREVMTAAALMVVLGSALFMQWGGLSDGDRQLLAGVLLSKSTFRHQLEADVEPFRGLLLGLFFLGVGMSLDLNVVVQNWQIIAGGVVAFIVVKFVGIYVVARLFGAKNREAIHRASMFAQGGEFAFVLYATALSAGILDTEIAAGMTAIVILSMALTPLLVMAVERLTPPEKASMDGIEEASDLHGRVLFVGFGRFAQVVCAAPAGQRDRCFDHRDRRRDDPGRRHVRFRDLYGDGTRLDVLRVMAPAHAEAILVCVEKAEVADKIVELCQSEFPHAKLFVRAFDRGHALRLINAGVEYQLQRDA